MDDEGKEWFREQDLGRVAKNYFKKLYASENLGYQIEELEEIPPSLTQRQCEELMAPISEEEVKQAVFAMNPSKCPAPDGMNGFFFQQFWEVIKRKPMEMVADFFRSGILYLELNRTNICLIPKKIRAKKLMESDQSA